MLRICSLLVHHDPLHPQCLCVLVGWSSTSSSTGAGAGADEQGPSKPTSSLQPQKRACYKTQHDGPGRQSFCESVKRIRRVVQQIRRDGKEDGKPGIDTRSVIRRAQRPLERHAAEFYPRHQHEVRHEQYQMVCMIKVPKASLIGSLGFVKARGRTGTQDRFDRIQTDVEAECAIHHQRQVQDCAIRSRAQQVVASTPHRMYRVK